jgi:hypothetical protein
MRLATLHIGGDSTWRIVSLAAGMLSNYSLEMSNSGQKEWSHESDSGGRLVVHRGETPLMCALAGTLARSYRILRDRRAASMAKPPPRGRPGTTAIEPT